MESPINVWNEVRITSEGISISLISESPESDAIVEDELWLTFDELQAMSPTSPQSLNLSDETEQALADGQQSAGQQQVSDETITVGSVVSDKRPPEWAEDGRMKVVNFAKERADEYAIEAEDTVWEKTVFSKNTCEPKEKVVECVHPNDDGTFPESPDESDIYAYPISRLEAVADGCTCTPAWNDNA